MRHLKLITVIITVSFVLGCSPFPPSPPAATPGEDGKAIMGIGVTESVTEQKKFNNVLKKNRYYAQLYITTELFEDAVKGPDARTFSDYIVGTYGRQVEQFGIVVIPKLNSVDLPETPIFTYKHQSETGDWSSSFTPRYSSPFIPLNDDSQIGFEFKYVTSDSTDLDLQKFVNDAMGMATVLNPGAWVISEASQKLVGGAADSISKTISNVLKEKEQTNVSDRMEPVVDGMRARVYMIKAGNKNIAKITFTTRVFTSLVSGSQVAEDDVPTEPTPPQMDPDINPLNRIKIAGGSSKTLKSELSSKPEFSLVGIKDPEKFREVCIKIIDELEGQYGLTVYDSLNAMRHLLLGTNFTKDKELFESDCINSSQKKLLQDMKAPIFYEGRQASTPLTDESLRKLSAYMKTPDSNSGYASEVLNIFYPDSRILVNSIPGKFLSLPSEKAYYYRQDLLRELGKIGVAKSWWQKQVDENGMLASGMIMYFRTIEQKEIFALEFNQYDGVGPVNNVTIRAVLESEISVGLRNKLLEPAAPLVARSADDVMLEK